MERTNSCGLKNLTFKQTKPFRATRQDDRDSFDRGASSLVSTAPRRIHAGRRLYCCPRSCVPGRPKPVGLSAAPVSIFERRYVTSGPSLQSHRAGAAEPRAPYRASDLVLCRRRAIAQEETHALQKKYKLNPASCVRLLCGDCVLSDELTPRPNIVPNGAGQLLDR